MPADLREQLAVALGSAYSVERELGGGGMSRVFVATEHAFGRQVVVKVLEPELAEGVSAERFKREITVAARLQHPHIVPLLSAGEQDGLLYYSMPLVEGESLRSRLTREIELPVADVIRTVRHIASALGYAHRHGIVHRDIKPENVLVTDGTAVVTDFGIAKALTAARTSAGAQTDSITQLGMAIGTPAYMSPEQASGDPNVDHRADVYALGCVAYELLSGRPPFSGRSAHAVMAAHASAPPEDITRLRPTTPPLLASLVMQSLEKRAADRPQSTDDVLRALDGIVVTPREAPALPARRSWRRHLVLGTALLAFAVTAIILVRQAARPPALAGPVRRWSIVLPDSAPMDFAGSAPFGQGRPALAISPDGSLLVYVARVGAATMLYARQLDQLDSRPMSGTEGAFLPFFSPDGKWIAFFSGRQLKKIAVDGSGLVTLAQVSDPINGAWTPNGEILFVADPGFGYSVPEVGGQPRPLEGIDITGSSTSSILSANWLLSAGGRRLTLTDINNGSHLVVTATGLVPRDSAIRSGALFGSGPHYARSGHIVYAASGEEGTLMAVPFDPKRRKVTGPPKAVLQGVRQESGQDGPAQFALAEDGTLVYAPGENAARALLVRRHHTGGTDTLPFPRADYGEFRVAPDGRHAMLSVWPPSASREAFIVDLERGVQLTPAASNMRSSQSSWWPDGKSVLIHNGDSARVYTTRVSASNGQIIDTVRLGAFAYAASHDSSQLLVGTPDRELWLAPRDTSRGKGIRIARAPAFFPAFSPDGQWISYTGRVAGKYEVMLVRSTNPGESYQVSQGGGEEGIWSTTGREIIYRQNRRWFAVRVLPEADAPYDAPRFLFEGSFENVPGWSHDVTRDGSHLLLLVPAQETTTRLNVVTNWFSELDRLAPPANR